MQNPIKRRRTQISHKIDDRLIWINSEFVVAKHFSQMEKVEAKYK